MVGNSISTPSCLDSRMKATLLGVWQLDPLHTQVEFAVKHLGMMTVRGHFADVQASGDINVEHPEASSVGSSSRPRAFERTQESPAMVVARAGVPRGSSLSADPHSACPEGNPSEPHQPFKMVEMTQRSDGREPRADEVAHRLAKAVRDACVHAALENYELAGLSGLCAEGRWEMAVDSMRSLELDSVVIEVTEDVSPQQS